MTLQSKRLGNQSEQTAAKLLARNGYEIIEQNLRTHFGEVDILARDGQKLVIVEVKAKSSDKYGSAIEMITAAKRRKLILLAHELQAQYQTDNVRIDVVTVDNAATVDPIVKHYKGVIEYHG